MAGKQHMILLKSDTGDQDYEWWWLTWSRAQPGSQAPLHPGHLIMGVSNLMKTTLYLLLRLQKTYTRDFNTETITTQWVKEQATLCC